MKGKEHKGKYKWFPLLKQSVKNGGLHYNLSLDGNSPLIGFSQRWDDLKSGTFEINMISPQVKAKEKQQQKILYVRS